VCLDIGLRLLWPVVAAFYAIFNGGVVAAVSSEARGWEG